MEEELAHLVSYFYDLQHLSMMSKDKSVKTIVENYAKGYEFDVDEIQKYIPSIKDRATVIALDIIYDTIYIKEVARAGFEPNPTHFTEKWILKQPEAMLLDCVDTVKVRLQDSLDCRKILGESE